MYQKDPDRCIDALVAMGVLVPGGDRTAVRRTAEFFLTSFQARALCRGSLRGACLLICKGTEKLSMVPGCHHAQPGLLSRLSMAPRVEAQERLATQRAEAAINPEYGKTFKAQASADDKKARRKQILSSIGAPLLPRHGQMTMLVRSHMTARVTAAAVLCCLSRSFVRLMRVVDWFRRGPPGGVGRQGACQQPYTFLVVCLKRSATACKHAGAKLSRSCVVRGKGSRSASPPPSHSWCARSRCWTASGRAWTRALTSARSRRPMQGGKHAHGRSGSTCVPSA